MFVYKKNPAGIKLFSHVKTFFYSKQIAKLLTTCLKTIYTKTRQCSNQLSSEDPYIGSRPICWVHLNPWKEWNTKWWCELWKYKFMWRYDRRSGNCTLRNCKVTPKKFRDFNGIRTHGLCVRAAVLLPIELWRPINWEQANFVNKRLLLSLSNIPPSIMSFHRVSISMGS